MTTDEARRLIHHCHLNVPTVLGERRAVDKLNAALAEADEILERAPVRR